MHIINYDTIRYPLRSTVSDILELGELVSAHHAVRAWQQVTRATDQNHDLHRRFYAGVSKLNELYTRFVREVVAPAIPGASALIYQVVPNFRVHFPHSMAVGEFHTDRDYGHQLAEINCWVPLTPAFATNTVWIESEPGKGDYKPAELDYGIMLLFRGSLLRHGNKTNETGKTRMSIDFRVLREADYDPDNQNVSVNTSTPLRLGGYFAKMAD